MDWQTLVSALIVTGCAAYAAWKLMPAALRQHCRAAIGIHPPAPAAGCGDCGGCAGAPKPAGAAAVVRIVRMPRDV